MSKQLRPLHLYLGVSIEGSLNERDVSKLQLQQVDA